MNCKTFKKLMVEYVYRGEEKKKPEFQEHYHSCLACKQLFDEISQVVSLLGNMAANRYSTEEMAALRFRVRQSIARMEKSPAPATDRTGLKIFSRPFILSASGAVLTAAILLMILVDPFQNSSSLISPGSNQAEELVTMTEVIEEEYDSVDELCREMDELQKLFFQDTEKDSKDEVSSKNSSVVV